MEQGRESERGWIWYDLQLIRVCDDDLTIEDLGFMRCCLMHSASVSKRDNNNIIPERFLGYQWPLIGWALTPGVKSWLIEMSLSTIRDVNIHCKCNRIGFFDESCKYVSRGNFVMSRPRKLMEATRVDWRYDAFYIRYITIKSQLLSR